MNYTKPFLTISQQIQLLNERGLIIDDTKKANYYLSNISYYRLSAYMLPFKKQDVNRFEDDITFSIVLDTYIFDREMRLLIFNAIEKIEVAFRTQFIYQSSCEKGAYWFADQNNFIKESQFVKFKGRYDKELSRSSEVFIKHFKEKYHEDPYPPSWMSFEILSFGLISQMCQNLKDYSVRNSIASHFGFTATQRHIFESWLASCVYVRNICAHHARLWNRNLVDKPALLNKTSYQWIESKTVSNRKLYYFICVLRFLLNRINPESNFTTDLRALINKYQHLPLHQMGLPDNWQEIPFWQT